MSDDDDLIINGILRANRGFSLPSSPNATHNAGLSPVFWSRVGYKNPWGEISEGLSEIASYWNITASSVIGTYYTQLGNEMITPSSAWNQNRASAFSLRCLVSTTNSYMINLVSDNPMVNNPTYANFGITLPNDASATHNINLSSLYFTNSGRGNSPNLDTATTWRGTTSYLWSTNAKTSSESYAIGIHYNYKYITPNFYVEGVYPYSLRCLVSTTNS